MTASTGLTAGAVRAHAEGRGTPISWAQWRGYERWGLIDPLPDESWPEITVERVIEIAKLSATTRSLARRVVLLRRNYLLFPVRAKLVRCAMDNLIPTIRRPVRKMRTVDRAGQWWAWRQGGAWRRGAFAAEPLRLGLDDCSPLLLGADSERLESAITSAYYFAGSVLPDSVSGTEYDVVGIPFEELVTLVLVRQLAADAPRHPTREEDRLEI